MRRAEPPGVRSCRDGGNWEMARAAQGGTTFYVDLNRLLGPLEESEREVLRADIHQKMMKAQLGTCVFGRGRSFDVDTIDSTRSVLELRLVDHARPTQDGDSDDLAERHTRIYFTEPDHLPRCLLFLSLRSKCPGSEGLAEQDADAAAAERIADEHCRR